MSKWQGLSHDISRKNILSLVASGIFSQASRTAPKMEVGGKWWRGRGQAGVNRVVFIRMHETVHKGVCPAFNKTISKGFVLW